MASRAIGLTYWLKMRANEMTKLKMLKPFARRLYGKISTVYATMSGVKARLEKRALDHSHAVLAGKAHSYAA